MLSGYDLPQHLDKDLKRQAGISFKEDFPNEYDYICKVWKIRNDVAHGKKANIKIQGRYLEIDRENINKFLNAVKVCIGWLDKI